MATGGRVLHHLRGGAARPRNTVLFVGYQAAGTRGRQLLDGAKTRQDSGPATCRSPRTSSSIDSMSAHADSSEIMRWLVGILAAAAMTYLVHGEPAALEALRDHGSHSERDWPVHVAGATWSGVLTAS